MQVNTSAIGAITPYSKHSFLVKFSFMRSFPIMSKNSFIIFLFKICMIQISVLHYSKLHFGLFKSPVIICRTSSCVQFALIASWRMNLAKSSLISFSVIVISLKFFSSKFKNNWANLTASPIDTMKTQCLIIDLRCHIII